MTPFEELKWTVLMIGVVFWGAVGLLFFLVCVVKCCTYAYLKAKYSFESRYPKKENGTNANST